MMLVRYDEDEAVFRRTRAERLCCGGLSVLFTYLFSLGAADTYRGTVYVEAEHKVKSHLAWLSMKGLRNIGNGTSHGCVRLGISFHSFLGLGDARWQFQKAKP